MVRREVAAQIGVIAADIRADVLLKDPLKAAALAEKLFSLDDVIFNRADDSDGVIGADERPMARCNDDLARAARCDPDAWLYESVRSSCTVSSRAPGDRLTARRFPWPSDTRGLRAVTAERAQDEFLAPP